MSTIYNYIYYHLFELVSQIRKLNARESAILYLSAIIFFLTMPFVAAGFRYIGNVPRTVFLIVILGYSFVIVFLNTKYFQRSHKIKEVSQKFENESLAQKRIGYGVVIALFAFSIVSFVLLLSIL